MGMGTPRNSRSSERTVVCPEGRIKRGLDLFKNSEAEQIAAAWLRRVRLTSQSRLLLRTFKNELPGRL